MASDFLAKLGLRVASVAALGATTVALTTTQVGAASIAQATPNLHDYGTTLRNAVDLEVVVADQQNQNQNRAIGSGDKPAELSDLA